jgi:hypothetical protein
VLTIRRVLEGKRREVLHLLAASLSAEKPDQPDQCLGESENNGQVAGWISSNPIPNPTTKADQNPAKNGPLVGLVGSDSQQESPPGANHTGQQADDWGNWQ